MPGCTRFAPGEVRKAVADLITNQARTLLGKGPESVTVSVRDREIVILLKGFLTPLEKALTRNGRNHELVELIRTRLSEESIEDYEALQRRFGVRATSVESVIDFANDQRTMIVQIRPIE